MSELIEREPSLIDQIRLYQDMRQYVKAIKKAYEAFNEELVLDTMQVLLKDQDLDLKTFF